MTNDELLQAIRKAAKDGVTKLDLSRKRLTTLPAEISQLTNLNWLDLSGNQLTTLPAEIGQLTNLNWLSLSNNQLTTLLTEIGQITSLSTLSLSNNQLTTLLAEIGQLTNLNGLDLSGNQLTTLPAEIAQLTNLNWLYLSGNQLTTLPAEIAQFTNLSWLSLSDNQLTMLPVEIGQLTNLSWLSLSDNQLTMLPVEIGQLTNLRVLYLRGNQLTTLPVEISQFTSLSELDLSSNQLIMLPAEIGQLTNLSELDLSGNQLINLPPELQAGNAQEIVKFYRQQLEQETDRLYEAKLLIIGEAGAGKTTLAKKIEDSTYQLQPDELSTDGIEIIRYRFPIDNDKEFQINIWDFGGQQIYHQTHQFFLTKRSLYILVADARKEDTDFYYWLNVVELLSDNSPLLIIKNERQDIKLEINERQLRGEFTNLKETLATNLFSNRGLSEILTQIKHYISNLPHVGTELPKTWVKVREALEQETRSYISLEEYLKLCTDNGFKQLEDALQLSSYLHDLGVCLHFQEDDLLNKTVILKPTWGTDAVYRVLRNPQVTQNLGKFTKTDLAAIWQDKQYATMRPELLRLMMNFKLCYEIPNQTGNYIAPQLLSPKQPDYTWDESENLLLRCKYEFMPKGILTRFIVEMHHWIEQQTYVWRTGVVLSKDDARADVIELYHKGEIRIRVSGKRQRDLLTIIRYNLDEIHRSYERLKYDTLVPCNCQTCKGRQTPYFYLLKELHDFLDNHDNQIQCRISRKMVDVNGLVNDIDYTRSRLVNNQVRDAEHQLEGIQPMTEPSKYNFPNARIVQITETNHGQTIGVQNNNYATNPELQKAITDLQTALNQLQTQHPQVETETAALAIIDAEFTEIEPSKTSKLVTLRKQLLNPERHLQATKAALSEAAKHYLEESIWAKTFITYLDKLSEEPNHGA
jgi:internalin A